MVPVIFTAVALVSRALVAVTVVNCPLEPVTVAPETIVVPRTVEPLTKGAKT